MKIWLWAIVMICALGLACGVSTESIADVVIDTRITIGDIQDAGFQETVASIYDYQSSYYNIEARNDPWNGKVVINDLKQDITVLVFFTDSLDDRTREQVIAFGTHNSDEVVIVKNVGIFCKQIEVCEHVSKKLE